MAGEWRRPLPRRKLNVVYQQAFPDAVAIIARVGHQVIGDFVIRDFVIGEDKA